ncbi:malate synthase-domain-containing protein [Fomitopsis serialis]|uniref:malate synthase-domain-containing protein n=1 Tax=Fomitopsis serialis TaxID=139415 RepID=UPI0020087E71|nr:malate synthase-domain-containing protein [Neoantrodia serialis]KAH9935728.1 malate synthase-domain-containing protein [Neoantrodia serialis]
MVAGVQIHTSVAQQAQSEILTEDALKFLAALHRTFESTRQSLLIAREAAQLRLDAGQPLDFPPETAHIRADPSWLCAAPAPGLEDRRVEITGPTDRKMVINALNSGTKTFMADFEDANCPTFANMVSGQVNLRDAIRRKIDFEQGGKQYKLSEKPAVLIVRPRGWHLDEPRLTIDNAPMSSSRAGRAYYYLPKMEHYLEARLWNDVFNFSQSYIGIPLGTIRGTMEEILFELRTHSSGLNCGRWDYIFSFIKKRRADRSAVLPDRKDVTMEVHFMDPTMHRRRVAAMGGMSAQIPIKNDVRNDKLREVTAGHDGTWIAHPLINKIAMDIFNEHMWVPTREDVKVAAADLLSTKAPGQITSAGVRENVATALSYSAAWLGGNALAVGQVGVRMADKGETVTAAYVDRVIDELVPAQKGPMVSEKNLDIIAKYLKAQIRKEWPSEFLTSDLMGYLAVADGCPAAWQKSVL